MLGEVLICTSSQSESLLTVTVSDKLSDRSSPKFTIIGHLRWCIGSYIGTPLPKKKMLEKKPAKIGPQYSKNAPPALLGRFWIGQQSIKQSVPKHLREDVKMMP